MMKSKSPSFRLAACQRCGGDAYLDESDEPEWRCLQCARTVREEATPRFSAQPAALQAA